MAERILAACTLLLAALYLYATSRLPSLDIGDPLGPQAFPYLIGSLLLGAGLLLLVEQRGKPRTAQAGAPSQRGALSAVAFVTVLFFVLLEPLGYLIALSLYLSGLMLALHGKARLLSISVAVLFSIASYALFVKLLGVGLAKGILYF